MKYARSFPIRNTQVVSRVPEILRLCAKKKVLHLGCAGMLHTLQRGDNLLHYQLARVTGPDRLWGLDNSLEGVRILREKGFENVTAICVLLTRNEYEHCVPVSLTAGGSIEKQCPIRLTIPRLIYWKILH
jgi:hypothetical protein